MYGYESWTIKKDKSWRIDAFELWCWRLLRVPWTARRSNQSILKEISPEHSLEGLMLKLKLQYFGVLKNCLIGKDLDTGKDWKQAEKGMAEDEMAGCHHWTWIWASFGSWWWAEHAAVHGVAKSQTWLSDWTVVNIFFLGIGIYNFLKKIFQNTRSFLCLILILLNLISLHPLFFIL